MAHPQTEKAREREREASRSLDQRLMALGATLTAAISERTTGVIQQRTLVTLAETARAAANAAMILRDERIVLDAFENTEVT